MLIAVSGAQGTGKTTVLKDLESRGHRVIPNKTSRSILSDWGYTLNEVNKYAPLTKQFQEEIIKRHYEYSKEHLETDELVFCERSYADIFTYALFAIGSYNEYSEWLNDYYHRCRRLQAKYTAVINLMARVSQIENDGVRSVNPHFADAIDRTIAHTQNSWVLHSDIQGGTPIMIRSTDHSTRIEEILNAIQGIEK